MTQKEITVLMIEPGKHPKVKNAIMEALDADLPDSYDKEVFIVKIDLLLNHFIDMAVQGYGWVAA